MLCAVLLLGERPARRAGLAEMPVVRLPAQCCPRGARAPRAATGNVCSVLVRPCGTCARLSLGGVSCVPERVACRVPPLLSAPPPLTVCARRLALAVLCSVVGTAGC